MNYFLSFFSLSLFLFFGSCYKCFDIKSCFFNFFGLMVSASTWPRKSRRQNTKGSCKSLSSSLSLSLRHSLSHTPTPTYSLTHSSSLCVQPFWRPERADTDETTKPIFRRRHRRRNDVIAMSSLWETSTPSRRNTRTKKTKKRMGVSERERKRWTEAIRLQYHSEGRKRKRERRWRQKERMGNVEIGRTDQLIEFENFNL